MSNNQNKSNLDSLFSEDSDGILSMQEFMQKIESLRGESVQREIARKKRYMRLFSTIVIFSVLGLLLYFCN